MWEYTHHDLGLLFVIVIVHGYLEGLSRIIKAGNENTGDLAQLYVNLSFASWSGSHQFTWVCLKMMYTHQIAPFNGESEWTWWETSKFRGFLCSDKPTIPLCEIHFHDCPSFQLKSARFCHGQCDAWRQNFGVGVTPAVMRGLSLAFSVFAQAVCCGGKWRGAIGDMFKSPWLQWIFRPQRSKFPGLDFLRWASWENVLWAESYQTGSESFCRFLTREIRQMCPDG